MSAVTKNLAPDGSDFLKLRNQNNEYRKSIYLRPGLLNIMLNII